MSAGFQCYLGADGNIEVADGVVIDRRTGAFFLVGSGRGSLLTVAVQARNGYQMASQASGTTFVGGSGRNLVCTGLAAIGSGPPSPNGFFFPTVPDEFRNGIFTLVVTGSSAATISDGTAVIAELTTGGTAPAGSYDSTSYGATTYNGGAAFTLTMAAEDASGGAIPKAAVTISHGTALAGEFSTTDSVNFTSDDDADWTLAIDPSGSAELRYLGAAMAERAAGLPFDPTGVYEATTAGKAAFNLTADEPVDGEPWRAFVNVVGRPPRVGVCFLKLTETAGVLTAVEGPFFETSQPASTSTDFYYPLGVCDGFAFEQFKTGSLDW